MIEFLAQACKELREGADPKRKIIHVAVVADVDPTTIFRFERGQWPRNPDRIVSAYAEELQIDTFEIWSRAFELFAEATERPADAEHAAAATEAVRKASQKARTQTPSKPRAKGKKRAAG